MSAATSDLATGTTVAANLREAAAWLDAHPDLPPVQSLTAYGNIGGKVTVSFRVGTDAEADMLLSLTDDDGWRTDYRYEAGESRMSRIADGHLGSERLSLTVAVPR